MQVFGAKPQMHRLTDSERRLAALFDGDQLIDARNAKRAEELVSDHLMRTLATINIWQ